MHFQTQVALCSMDLNMGIISGTTHFKMALSFLPGDGKHFCSQRASVASYS
jgi:hypothetical protein